jgi:hypothetical protein
MDRVGVTTRFHAFAVGAQRLTLAFALAMPLALAPALPAAQAQTTDSDQAAPAPAAKPKPKPRAKPAAAPAAPAGPSEVWALNLKSEPPGALAKAANGSSCVTPCAISIPRADTSVTFTLAGYLPQVIPIKWLPAMFHYEMYERTDQGIAVYPVDFSPNPAIAQLVPSGRPKAAPKTAAKTAAKKNAPADAAPPQ